MGEGDHVRDLSGWHDCLAPQTLRFVKKSLEVAHLDIEGYPVRVPIGRPYASVDSPLSVGIYQTVVHRVVGVDVSVEQLAEELLGPLRIF